MTEEFHRIRRLPPYVFAEVNGAKAKARSSGEHWARADLDLRLGRAATSQADEVAELPAAAAQLVLTSVDLYDRVARLHDRVRRDQSPADTPVHALHARLAQQL